jgi:hypothetical protein
MGDCVQSISMWLISSSHIRSYFWFQKKKFYFDQCFKKQVVSNIVLGWVGRRFSINWKAVSVQIVQVSDSAGISRYQWVGISFIFSRLTTTFNIVNPICTIIIGGQILRSGLSIELAIPIDSAFILYELESPRVEFDLRIYKSNQYSFTPVELFIIPQFGIIPYYSFE